jgi:hypothetical protein
MRPRDTYERVSGSWRSRPLKLYLSCLGLVVGVLTIYQSIAGTESPLVVGVALSGVSAISLVGQLLATR